MTRIPRNLFSADDGDDPVGPDWDPGAPERQPFKPGVPKRFLTTLALVTVFFAGAAFVAGAGDQAAKLVQDEEASQALSSDPSAEDELAPGEQPAEEEAGEEPAAEASVEGEALEAAPPATSVAIPAGNADVPESAPAAPEAAADPAAPADSAPAPESNADQAAPAEQAPASLEPSRPAPAAAAKRIRHKLAVRKPAPDPEVQQPGVSATIWLNRALPDPTPPAKRLTKRFAARLAKESKQAKADWALVLGVLRAEGATGSAPAGPATLERLGNRLVALEADGRDRWEAAAAFVGDTATADRAVALGHFYRSVGLWSLVHGLQAAKKPLVAKVLADPRILIYPGGRSDLERGRVDVRIVAVIAYMAERFGQVTVTSLISGHRLYSRPGVVSAHVYGHAIDIASLGGQPIQGNQGPESVTERAVRDLLLLPPELLPRQVISLLGLGGPSFPMADHYNHIHVGY